MSWFGSSSTKAPPQAKAAVKAPAAPAFPASSVSVEFPTTVSARGIAPANAVVEHLTAAECRFRTVVYFDPGDVIEFAFGFSQESKVAVRGKVVTRTSKGPRFIYQMRLEGMPGPDLDRLARTLAECYRRQALTRRHEAMVRNLPTTERLTRSDVRVLARFPMIYRTPKENPRDATAGDVSAGGMLMFCKEALVEGEPVELRFTLPSDVLDALPEETLMLDMRKGTATPARKDRDPRRAFTEMVVGARVVNHRPVGNGTYAYGLAYTCLDGYQAEEIARYANAAQRARSRR
jgi:hypothetical protein